MHIQPRFSGVYLKPTHGLPLEASPTGHGFFEHNEKSYYTTHEDTVTLHQARKGSNVEEDSKAEKLTGLYAELAAKAPKETLTLAGMLAAQLSQNAIPQQLRSLPKRTLAQFFQAHGNGDEIIGSPRQLLKEKTGLEDAGLDAIELGLSEHSKRNKRS